MIRRLLGALPALFLAREGSTPRAGSSQSEELAQARQFLAAGRFDDASEAFARARPDQHHDAAFGLGQIALLRNDLAEAERWLQAAVEARRERARQRLLAEVYYRRGDYRRAAPLLRDAGSEAVARKLESFRDVRPYELAGPDATRVAFIHTDPLPLVPARVNGGAEANFLIDTGGAEVILDHQFAAQAGAARFGSAGGTFGGGRQAAFGHGRVDSLTLGDFTLENVPVHLLDTRPLSVAAQGKPVAGIVGTGLLSRFLSTLDYPGGELVLRRRTPAALEALAAAAQAEGAHSVPFWLAGDHYMVAWGQVNQSPPLLFWVDTGVAGGGFTCPESTLKEARIEVGQPCAEGTGGGGRVKVASFVVDDLALGPVRRAGSRPLRGLPPDLERAFGFRIAGMVSHLFFRSYALTFDFDGMRLLLKKQRRDP